MNTKKRKTWWRHLGFAVITVVLLMLAAMSPATVQRSLAREDAQGMIVVVWPTPSVQVARGDILTYQVQVKNFNRNAHSNIRVYIPYDNSQITFIGAEFEDNDNEWISELSPAHVLVKVEEIAGGQSIAVNLFARVAGDLPDGTVITTWPSYSWNDSRSQKKPRSSNAVPVVVGAINEASPFVWMSVDPTRGTASTTYLFFSDRFLPLEPVQASIIAPGDTILENRLNAAADERGRIWFNLSGAGLAPGTYHMVAVGHWSNLQSQVSFVVEP